MAGYRARQVAVGIAVAAAVAVHAQDEPQPAPTFRSEINYVQLPVRVLDSRGDFVRGLAQSDFQVFEDGKAHPISAFTAVDIPFIAADRTVPDVPVAAVDPVASNDSTEVDGRVYLFVLDDYHTPAGSSLQVRALVRRLVEERLGANDVAAFVLASGKKSQDFTRNRRLMLDAADRFVGEYDPEQTQDSEHRMRSVLMSIGTLAESMGAVRGRRKALVLVGASQLCSVAEAECRGALRDALDKAVRADVSIYAIDPRGLVSAQPNRDAFGAVVPGVAPKGMRPLFAELHGSTGSGGARYLADQSGGFAIAGTNNLDRALERVVRENSSYYLLGYYSTNAQTDGRLRRNEVKVVRKGAQVVHRQGYNAPRAPAASLSRGTITDQLTELARSPLPVSAMTLRVAAVPFLSSEGKARAMVVVEIPHEALRPSEGDGRYRLNIGLSIGFYDRDGRFVAGDDPTMDLDIALSAAPKVTPNGVRIASRVTVPPGVYRLWVGAVQPAGGLRGSVTTEIDVPDFDRDPLALSAIALSSTEARRIFTARTDDLLDDVFGGPPVAHRDFILDSDLWLYGEIYDHRSDGGDVSAEVTVKAADGKVVYQAPFEAAPVQFGHLARIPLKEIGRGSFVAVVEVRSSSPAPVSATRTVAFRVK
jgi:VWFA-related protein